MRVRAAIAVAMLLPAGARADWQSTPIAGTPHDIHVLDAGYFVVMTSTETRLKHCPQGGVCSDVMSGLGVVAGAGLDPMGCLFGVTFAASITGCGYTGTLNGTPSQSHRLRCFGGGVCSIASQQSGAQALLHSTTSPGSAPASWRSAGIGGTANPGATLPLHAITGATVSNVTYQLSVSAGPSFLMVVDGGWLPAGASLPGTSNSAFDGVLFLRPNNHLGMIAVLSDTAPERERFGTDVTMGATGASVDAGWAPSPIAFDPDIGGLKYLTYTELGGSSAGFGFGMGSQRDGGLILAGAVPNPNAPGMLWVPRAGGVGQLPVSSQLRAISCIDPTFCVALPVSGTNVFVYWNDDGFLTAALRGPPAISEGTSVLVDVLASEGDGDPFWIGWESDGGPVSVAGLSDGGTYNQTVARVTAGMNPGGTCSQQLPITALLSDGWAPHDLRVALDGGMTYLRTTPDPIQPLMVNPAAAVAGLSGVTATTITGTCSGELDWRLRGPDAGAITVAGATATYLPPAHYCVADGGDTIEVHGWIDGGSVTATQSAFIRIVPWGAPNAPQFVAASPAMQSARSTVTYPFVPTNRHVCESATGFPGVVPVLVSAGAMPPVIVSVSDAGLTVSSTDECVDSMVNALVRYDVAGDTFMRPSANTPFEVRLNRNFDTIGPGSQFSSGFQLDGGGLVAHGTFSVDAGCQQLRMLGAGVVFTGTVALDAGGFPVPGPWSTALPSTCGGPVTATASLFEDGGVVATETTMFTVPPILDPIGPGSMFSMGLQVDAGGAEVHGRFTVDAGCVAQRGLTAIVTITGPTPAVVGPFPVPGLWSHGIRNACNGGMFMASATLYEDGGIVAIDPGLSFPALRQDAGVGLLDPQELPVTCDGVDSDLTVLRLDGACPPGSTAVTWTQTAGPPLEPNDGGAKIRVRSVARGLDGLIGETLTFDILSDAMGGNAARATRSVLLVPGRFVTLAHRISPEVPSRDDVVTVSVDVHNTGTCRVSGVTLVEDPTGLRYIENTARVGGTLVPGTGTPTIGPFDLEAGQTVKVTWLGKATLQSTPRARGKAFINGQQVSLDEPEPPAPTGCGCSSGPSALLLAGLLAALGRRRPSPRPSPLRGEREA